MTCSGQPIAAILVVLLVLCHHHCYALDHNATATIHSQHQHTGSSSTYQLNHALLKKFLTEQLPSPMRDIKNDSVMISFPRAPSDKLPFFTNLRPKASDRLLQSSKDCDSYMGKMMSGANIGK